MLLILFSLFAIAPLWAQYVTQTFTPSIKTLRVHYASPVPDEPPLENMPYRPYLVLPSSGVITEQGDANEHVLEISFDEMSHDVHQYTYRLHHLNADYCESDLTSQEYVSGFTTADIVDYEHSLNTQRNYTHYRFTLPSEDMHLTASGLYAVRIYEDGNPDNVVATVVFAVVEPQVDIVGSVTSHTIQEINGRYQQLDLSVSRQSSLASRQSSANMAGDYFVVVRQNDRIDNQVFAPKPSYIEANCLRWHNHGALIFEGGNEYRHLDIYSTYYAGYNVDRIRFDRNDYHAFLLADDVRTSSLYIHEYDTDGQLLINAERTDFDDTEAEYMWVHWFLPMAEPIRDGAIYIGGDVFGNRLALQNRMLYDNERHCYYLNALLKQGAYDYQYWHVPTATQQKITLQTIEGSHHETENCYTVYVYFRPFGSRADRLVGLRNILSR
ncbi:MAG: DUF5103 domain-containing protein [Paludibacteraceae bacterium]|nr:DUF5103 domain-containing protein [Candidatus Colicola coprequi]MCQ2333891.1 DUF5103 domain-containing protein [Paludibacteraceae bacterium]